MKAQLEFKLSHDGDQWIGRNGDLVVSGETMQLLDNDICRVLRESGQFPCGARVRVFLGFDFDTIPKWLRQYHSHYFNRLVTVTL